MSGAVDLEAVCVPVEQIKVGDELLLWAGLQRRVIRVELFDEDTGPAPGPRVRLIVSGGQVECYEGVRSGHAGARRVDVAEQGLRPFRPGELIRVVQ